MRYSVQAPGKRITTTDLIRAFNYWLRISDDKVQTINDISRMVHHANDIIDDIEDNSILRRGIPVAHSIYGIANTINAANYVTFIALERVLSLQHPEAAKVYLEQALEFHRGQGMEIFWSTHCICPTEADYKTMIIRKGEVFYLALKLMQLFSTCKEDLSLITDTFRLLFQISDDYCDLWLDEDTKNTSYCEDLTEGKFSLPIIHALTNNPDDKEIISILKQRTKDNEIKRYCVQLLEKYGSFKYTRNMLEELDSIARAEIERLGGNPHFVSILDQLKKWDVKNVPKNSVAGTS
ncbi:PREDICTED: geranylgeranyl pyrophosphate synthase-like isoform X2 [Vollenhovia emeryi]|nr:PREDICTED: geranylgeranyl pyrophosphate synthase-like isoform X2 [Vollenhovia emeryi]